MYLGGSSGIPKEHTLGFMPGGWARGQKLGHLCNVICICVKVFQMLITRQSLITKHSYLKLGYPGKSSEIPKELTPRFMPGDGTWGKNLGHLCNMLHAFPLCHNGLYIDIGSSVKERRSW